MSSSYKSKDAPITTTTVVKPGELIDIVEVTPLTLHDRRVFNLLLQNAWPTITDNTEHVILKADLKGNHVGNERIEDTLNRLQTTLVKIQSERDGMAYEISINLIGRIDRPVTGDGKIYYRFQPEVREVIANSGVFARLHKDVMLALSSKYALSLYEMIQKRGNLQHVWHETFTVERLRSLLGVPRDRLTSYKNFKARALIPAVMEVNGLSHFGVGFREIKKGRSVEQIQISWHRKSIEEMKKAFAELRQPKVGRAARLAGTVDSAL